MSPCANRRGRDEGHACEYVPWANSAGPTAPRSCLESSYVGESAVWPPSIVGCDAPVAWCSWLIDEGFRGELECIVAKIFGSEAQKEAAVELFMKTHGGRAFFRVTSSEKTFMSIWPLVFTKGREKCWEWRFSSR